MACFKDSGGPQIQRGKDGRWQLIGTTSGPGTPGTAGTAGTDLCGRTGPLQRRALPRGLDTPICCCAIRPTNPAAPPGGAGLLRTLYGTQG
jgi:hypothetical protein